MVAAGALPANKTQPPVLRDCVLASRRKYGTPTARRPYHFYEVLPHHPRGSALVPPKAGMARRRRPTCAARAAFESGKRRM